MTLDEQTILKLKQLPEPLVEEVSNFIDYLLWKHQASLNSTKPSETNSDFSDYLSKLEDYENRLACGEIYW